ncbi:MAG: NYN domain-containing protein [Candidatus Omnitrophica bacterium]|nr:NYN domain-containing protein [Candidatus Omnitrophota bacterium]
MSLRYIIDGCNLVHHPHCARNLNKRHRDSRLSLLEFIRSQRLCGSVRNKVTVVFDGFSSPEDFACLSGKLGIEVVFSRGDSADNVIRRMLEKAAQPLEVVVVSDDREVLFFARQSRARAMGVGEFLGEDKQPRGARGKTGKADPAAEKPELSGNEQERINREFRDIWLKEKP